MDARCHECDELLPWPLYQLRDLDGSTPEEAAKTITALIERTKEAADQKEAQA